jgi:ABC-type Na+ efflux pump permease subunit
MGAFSTILTISRWEVKRSLSTMSRNVLPVSLVLFLLLVLVSGFTAQNGMHLQDGMYRIGVTDPAPASIITGDSRFTADLISSGEAAWSSGAYDLIIAEGTVYSRDTEKGRAALRTFERDYAQYVRSVYNTEEDLFAAYPLWIDTQYVKSELTFQATQSGQYLGAAPQTGAVPVPEGPVVEVLQPDPVIEFTREELRSDLVQGASSGDQLSRYTSILSSDASMGRYKIPSQLSPPLPFDSIVLVFIFIFPLYFTSQFFMMTVMNERLERRGEVLLSAPIRPREIVIGKLLPYLAGMCLVSAVLALSVKASLIILLPLFPIMLFFLANALLIGMISRSFKELSFISIFFSTLATSYLFFPTIFAHVHVISLISPLTLIVLQLQGEGFAAIDYFYSTALFFLTSVVLFSVGIANYQEERLFNQSRFLPRIREFIESSLSQKRPYTSLFLLNLLLIPFVFMVQMMYLVLFFNLPMPYSLVLLIVLAALTEEIAKSIGVYTLAFRNPAFLSPKGLVIACVATALGFLAGEKLFLFAMLTQVTESIFGSVLFLSLQVLWMPFLLHLSGILIVATALRYLGTRGYVPGLLLATVVHSGYNLSLILGAMA